MGRKRKSRIYPSNAEKVQGTNDLDVVAASLLKVTSSVNKHRDFEEKGLRTNDLNMETESVPSVTSSVSKDRVLEKKGLETNGLNMEAESVPSVASSVSKNQNLEEEALGTNDLNMETESVPSLTSSVSKDQDVEEEGLGTNDLNMETESVPSVTSSVSRNQGLEEEALETNDLNMETESVPSVTSRVSKNQDLEEEALGTNDLNMETESVPSVASSVSKDQELEVNKLGEGQEQKNVESPKLPEFKKPLPPRKNTPKNTRTSGRLSKSPKQAVISHQHTSKRAASNNNQTNSSHEIKEATGGVKNLKMTPKKNKPTKCGRPVFAVPLSKTKNASPSTLVPMDTLDTTTPASVEPTNKTSTIRHRKRCRTDTRKNKLSNEVVNQKNNTKTSSECTNEKPLEKFEDKVLLVPQSSEFTVKDTPCEKKTEDGQITQPQSEEQSCPASSSIDKSVNSEASSSKNARPELCASNEFVKCKNGQVVELYFEKKPESFQTQKDEMMWKVGSRINLLRLRHELETGELAPESYRRKLKMTREEIIRQHFIPKEEKYAKRLQFLKDELALMQCVTDLRCSLRSRRPNIENGEEVLMKLLEIRKLPLMLKKNPQVVENLMQCTHYGDSEVVRKLSAQALENIEMLFDIPLGSSFDEVFCSSVNTFNDSTKHLTPQMKQLLTDDPTDPEYEPDLYSSDEGTDSDEVDDSDVDADYSPDPNIEE